MHQDHDVRSDTTYADEITGLVSHYESRQTKRGVNMIPHTTHTK